MAGKKQVKAARAAQAGKKNKKAEEAPAENVQPQSPYNLRASPRRNAQRVVSSDGTQPMPPKKKPKKPLKDYGDHTLTQIKTIG